MVCIDEFLEVRYINGDVLVYVGDETNPNNSLELFDNLEPLIIHVPDRNKKSIKNYEDVLKFSSYKSSDHRSFGISDEEFVKMVVVNFRKWIDSEFNMVLFNDDLSQRLLFKLLQKGNVKARQKATILLANIVGLEGKGVDYLFDLEPDTDENKFSFMVIKEYDSYEYKAGFSQDNSNDDMLVFLQYTSPETGVLYKEMLFSISTISRMDEYIDLVREKFLQNRNSLADEIKSSINKIPDEEFTDAVKFTQSLREFGFVTSRDIEKTLLETVLGD
jgi:hypothetical protein